MQANSVPSYPIGEPTSALNFNTLVTDVAYKIGLAYYGSTGQGAPQAPINAHDLTLCQNIVNRAIRMLLSDAPAPSGWFFQKPIGQIDLWPVITADAVLGTTSWLTSTSFDSTNNLTTLNLNYSSTVVLSTIATSTGTVPAFYPSMEIRNIYLGGNPPANIPGFFLPSTSGPVASTVGTPFTIVNYLNQSTVQVYGDARSTVGTSTTWSMASIGDYTMPANFAGSFAGAITFIANTNRGMILQWVDESAIRARRQNYNEETGTPFQCAVRLMPTPDIQQLNYAPQRRRWEMLTWRITNEWLHVIFPFVLGFDNLVNSTDVPPTPFLFDEALRAASFAVAELEVEDSIDGPHMQYYRSVALPNAYKVNAMAAPKRLGYNGNWGAMTAGWGQIMEDYRQWNYQRPNVTIGGPS